MSDPRPRALVVLAEGAEEMETACIVDVLRRGDVAVTVAGLEGSRPVRCSRGLVIVPDAPLIEAGEGHDLLVMPGGLAGAERLAKSGEVARRLRDFEASGRLVGAICAAPIVLKAHGVFAGRQMTCHPSVVKDVEPHGQMAPGPVVVDRNLVTSQGPGTAVLFALELLRHLIGDARAEDVRGPLMLPP
jgi:protein DJ-1